MFSDDFLNKMVKLVVIKPWYAKKQRICTRAHTDGNLQLENIISLLQKLSRRFIIPY